MSKENDNQLMKDFESRNRVKLGSDRLNQVYEAMVTHLEKNPSCAWCNASYEAIPVNQGDYVFMLHAHHKIPVDRCLELAGEPSNLLTMCNYCHLSVAHFGQWDKWNPSLFWALFFGAGDYPSSELRYDRLTPWAAESLSEILSSFAGSMISESYEPDSSLGRLRQGMLPNIQPLVADMVAIKNALEKVSNAPPWFTHEGTAPGS